MFPYRWQLNLNIEWNASMFAHYHANKEQD